MLEHHRSLRRSARMLRHLASASLGGSLLALAPIIAPAALAQESAPLTLQDAIARAGRARDWDAVAREMLREFERLTEGAR